ncbi:DUF7837 family putative zinc-binding protein [Halalkalirubrum salinum]
MSHAASTIGTCPFCSAVVPETAVLIEYVVNAEKRLFAECSQCGDPVRPQ